MKNMKKLAILTMALLASCSMAIATGCEIPNTTSEKNVFKWMWKTTPTATFATSMWRTASSISKSNLKNKKGDPEGQPSGGAYKKCKN